MPGSLLARPFRKARARKKGRNGRLLTACVIFGGCCLLLLAGAAQTPEDFTVEAFSGSYAPWGSNQYLKIDPSRNVAFYWSDLESTAGDSVFTTLTPTEAQALYDTVMVVNFFALDSLYDSGMVDGSGVVLRITASGTVHSVEAKNMPVSQVNRIVRTINTILGPDGIFLDYGDMNE